MEKTLKKIKWKHYANYIVIATLTLVFGLLSFGGSLSISSLYLLEKIANQKITRNTKRYKKREAVARPVLSKRKVTEEEFIQMLNN